MALVWLILAAHRIDYSRVCECKWSSSFRLSRFPAPPYHCSCYNTATRMLQDSTAFSVAFL